MIYQVVKRQVNCLEIKRQSNRPGGGHVHHTTRLVDIPMMNQSIQSYQLSFSVPIEDWYYFNLNYFQRLLNFNLVLLLISLFLLSDHN